MNDRWILAGVNSWIPGRVCGTPNSPVVYAEVAGAMVWIKNATRCKFFKTNIHRLPVGNYILDAKIIVFIYIFRL